MRLRLLGCGCSVIATTMLTRGIVAKSVVALTLVLFGAGRAGTQSRDSPAPAFDVASIHSVGQQPAHVNFQNATRIRVFPGGRLVTMNTSIRELVAFAYGLQDFELTDTLPSALAKATFDINATAGADIPLAPRGQLGPMNLMVQTLLHDRFKVVVRREQRQGDVLVLTRVHPDRLGPGLKAATPCGVADPNGMLRAEDGTWCFGGFVNDVLNVKGLTISQFARQLESFLLKRVVDRTGLAGAYDMTMTVNTREFPVYSRMWAIAGRTPAPSDAPTLSTALRERLGLRMTPDRESVTHYVIEHAEMPANN